MCVGMVMCLVFSMKKALFCTRAYVAFFRAFFSNTIHDIFLNEQTNDHKIIFVFFPNILFSGWRELQYPSMTILVQGFYSLVRSIHLAWNVDLDVSNFTSDVTEWTKSDVRVTTKQTASNITCIYHIYLYIIKCMIN